MKRVEVVTCGYVNVEVLGEKDEVEVQIVSEEPRRR